MDIAKIAERPDCPSSQFLIAQAQEHNIWLGSTIPVLAISPPNESIPAQNRTNRRTHHRHHPIVIAIPSICLTIILFTVGALLKGDTDDKIRYQAGTKILSQESS